MHACQISVSLQASYLSCRSPISRCLTQASLPFLSKLTDGALVPSVTLLETQQKAYALMRANQNEILSTLAEQLALTPQATRVSQDGFSVYNTSDESLSIAMQVCNALLDTCSWTGACPCMCTPSSSSSLFAIAGGNRERS